MKELKACKRKWEEARAVYRECTELVFEEEQGNCFFDLGAGINADEVNSRFKKILRVWSNARRTLAHSADVATKSV